MLILGVLKKLEGMIQRDRRAELFQEFPVVVPVTVGKIQAGTWTTQIPERCVLEGLLGYMPGQSYQEARGELEEYVQLAADLDPWVRDHPSKISWLGLNKKPSETPMDHPLVQTIEKSFRNVTGQRPGICALPTGTDASFLTKYGAIPTTLFGTRGGNCHTSDEYV